MALNDLGIARDLQGRHTDAQTCLSQALSVSIQTCALRRSTWHCRSAMSGQSKDAVQLLRPLANKPDASQQLRHDMAAVLAMTGDKTEAEQILEQGPAAGSGEAGDGRFCLCGVTAQCGRHPLAGAPAPERRSCPPTAVPTSRSSVGAPSIAATHQCGRGTAWLNRHRQCVDSSEKAAATAEHGNDGVEVQLAGPTPSRNAAQSSGGAFSGRCRTSSLAMQPIFAEVHGSGRTVWRVRTGGFMPTSARPAPSATMCGRTARAAP